MILLTTKRLTLRQARLDDAAFIHRLLNEPSWLKFIGDRGVRTVEDARAYIAARFIAVYERLGFGFFIVERKELPGPMGIAGLVKRDGLEDVDLGFAFLPEYWGEGFALESATGVMQFARDDLKLKRIVAISAAGNESAGRLLERVGFHFERMIRLSPAAEEIRLFVRDPL